MARSIIFMSFFLLINCNLHAITVPDSLVNFIGKELPDFSIVSTNDYVHGWNEYLKDKNELPYYCSSDFNGDSKPDYAILLIDSDKRLFLYAFIRENGDYKKILIDKYDSQVSSVQTIISVEKKGEWESVTDKITVPNDGIFVDFFEDSLSWSYYYDGKTFKKFLYD